MTNLNRIAQVLAQYDLVGLQEVDAGSLRSGFIGQTQYLAHRAGFPYWHHQVNRRIGQLAQHSNGLLSRLPVSAVSDLKLPGLPGRGALVALLGSDRDALTVFIIPLALRQAGAAATGSVSGRPGRNPHARHRDGRPQLRPGQRGDPAAPGQYAPEPAVRAAADLPELDVMPSPALQIDLGSLIGTGVSVRYFRGINLQDLGIVNVWGAGFTHNLNYWFDEVPIEIGFGYYFQDFKVGDIFKNKALQFGLFMSQRIGGRISIEPYASLTYENSRSEINYRYEFDSPAGKQELQLNIDYDGDQTVNPALGTSINLSIFVINFDYKFGGTSTGTIGVGFGF